MRLTCFSVPSNKVEDEDSWRRGVLRVSAGRDESSASFLDEDTGSLFEVVDPGALADAVLANFGRSAPGPSAIEGPALLFGKERIGRQLLAKMIAIGEGPDLVVFQAPFTEQKQDRRHLGTAEQQDSRLRPR